MPMKDRDLAALIDRESRNAIGADDFTSGERQRAMDYYHGDARGDLSPPDVQGRSSVVSKDLMETVEWAMPAMMDMFASADDVVRFEPDREEDEQGAEDATNYVGYLIRRKNDGFVTLHDAIKSALIQKIGVVKVYTDSREDIREERYRGLSQAELQALSEDPEVEIAEQVEYADPALPPEQAQAFDVLLTRKREVVDFRCEGVPPEEIRIAKGSRRIEDVRYIAHEVKKTISKLLDEGYPEDKVRQLQSDDDYMAEAEEQSRHDHDGSYDYRDDDGADASQREVTLTEAYVRVDYDGDGVSEYRRVVKAGGVIFENEVTDDHPFALFTPILMPYQVVGLSFFDLLDDLQRIRTALSRQMLDNAYLVNTPRVEVLDGKVNLDDLLSPRPGGIIRKKQVDAMSWQTVPFVGGQVLSLLQHFDEVRDSRSGVTEVNSALQVESLAKTNVGSQGVAALMSAGTQRIKLMARVFAETGVKRMYLLMLKLVTQHVKRQEQVKLNGRWLMIDPREWRNRYNVEVSVGIGTASREQKIMQLQTIGQAQEKVIPLGLAGPENVHHTVTRLVSAMGYSNADRFFRQPQPMPQQGGEQQGSPEAQAIIAAEQIKAQATMQKAQMDNETKILLERERIASEERVAMFEARARIELEQQKAAPTPMVVAR